MRSLSTLGGIALGILVLLFFLWKQLAPGAVRGPAPEVGSSSARGGAQAVEPGSSDGSSEPTVADRAGPQRAAIPAASVPAPTCQIRVVDALSGSPVPAARLWLQAEDVEVTSPAWMRAMRRFNDVEPVLQGGLGRELALDARGEVRVARPGKDLSVAAARGALHGEATLRPDDEECVIELRPYHPLAIEVVDRSSRPLQGAQVTVLWGAFDPLEHQNGWVSDEDGRVSIPKLEAQLWPDGYSGPVRVTLGGGVPCEPEIVLFDTDTVPEEPVRLVAGDFGSVVVQLVDPAGEEVALDGYAYVEVEWYERTAPEFSEPSLALRGGASLYLPLDAGRAVFGSVGLDLPLDIYAGADGHERVSRRVPGPTSAGQEVRVPIKLGERMGGVFRGRVRGMPRSWCTGETPGAKLDGRSERFIMHVTYPFSTWVLEGKPFECPTPSFPHEMLETPWLLELSRAGEVQMRATIVPKLDEGSGVMDFGEVLFEPQSLLADLIVVDQEGTGVSGALVEVRSGGRERTLACDREGRCPLTGQPTELPATVQAIHDDWLPSDEVVIMAAGGAHRLVLRRAATLEGRLLLPRGLSLDDVDLWLRVTESTTHVAHVVEGGRFRFEACEPGRATLSVSTPGHLLERGGIELDAGRTTELEPIDLTAELVRFELEFALADGTPWSGGHLEVLDLDGELSTWRTIGPSGRVLLFDPRPSVALWVGARGARATLFEHVVDGDRLTLPRAPALELCVSPQVPLPGPPLALTVRGRRVLPEDVPFEPDDEWDVEPALVRADGRALLQVPWPGDYELVWSLRRVETGAELEIRQLEPQTVHVPDAPALPAVEARLSAGELAIALSAGPDAWR